MSITLLLSAVTIIPAVVGCDELPTKPAITSSIISNPNAGVHPALKGTWIQWPQKEPGVQNNTVTFADGLGAIHYPDISGECEGNPRLLKEFEWSINGEEETPLLWTKTYRHLACGEQKPSGVEELHPFTIQGDTLRAFFHTWIRVVNS